MINWIFQISIATVLAVTLVCQPAWLAQNQFLQSFVTFELLNVLAVILTVTLASVANIHLSLTRIVRQKLRIPAGSPEEQRVRREINQNAWLLVGAFCLAIVLLLVKGAWPDEMYVAGSMNALAILVVSINIAALIDVYSVIYKLVATE